MGARASKQPPVLCAPDHFAALPWAWFLTRGGTCSAELTPAEVKQITSSYEFQSFVDQSAKKVERVLAMKYDPLVDYSGGDAEEHRYAPLPLACIAGHRAARPPIDLAYPLVHQPLSCHRSPARSDLAQGEAVGLRCTFFDERRTTNRAVTSMEWSPKV